MPGRCPTDKCKITPHGGYSFWRPDQVDPKSGTKGVMHWAWDLGGTAKETPVYAPEDGVVVETATGKSPPWTGFQPGLVLLKGASGVYHVLGHLDYPTIAVHAGQAVTMGTKLGVMGISHTHWEIRRNRTPNWAAHPTYWQAHGPNSIDPATWLESVNGTRRPLPAPSPSPSSPSRSPSRLALGLGLLAFAVIAGVGLSRARASVHDPWN